MQRRDLSTAVLALATGGALLSRPAPGQACSAPCHAQTAAEKAARITPVNTAWPPGHVDRYFTNTIPGTTSAHAGFQAAIDQARHGGVDVQWGDTGAYLLDGGALDCTFTGPGNQSGINFRQLGRPSHDYPAMLLVAHRDYAVFDLTGCDHFTFYDLSLHTASGSAPMTCFLVARNSSGESNLPRFYNTTVTGQFSTAILYNYAAEDGVYVGNFWANHSSVPGAKVVAITAWNNLLPGNGLLGVGMKSRFTTIWSGLRSTSAHQFFGGDYALHNPSSTGDVFYFDMVSDFRLYGGWLYCANAHAASNGRAYFYCDTTNGASDHVQLNGLQSESGPHCANYGVYFGNATATPAIWTLIGCQWNVGTAMVGASAAVTLSGLTVLNNDEVVARGIIVPGILAQSTIFGATIVKVGTSSSNWIVGSHANMRIATRDRDVIVDIASGQLYLSSGVCLNGTSTPLGPVTGFGTPSGNSVIGNFPGGSATLAQTSATVAEILTLLKGIGLIGA